MTPDSYSPLFERVAKTLGNDGARQWWILSEETHRASYLGNPGAAVRKLDAAADAATGSALAPAFRLWAADALARVRRDREAIASYDRVLAEPQSGEPFDRIDFAREALRQRADLFALTGDVDGAVGSFRELETRGERGALFGAGVAAEHAGRLEQAAELYREIAAAERGPNPHDLSQRALRAAERLTRRDGVYASTETEIASLVKRAITSRNGAELRRLASRTHFNAGPGCGHYHYETEEVVDKLCEALDSSRPQRLHRGLLGTGDKRYLLTSGWHSAWFQNVVGFTFVRTGLGWEWQGLVVNSPAEPWVERWAPKEKRTNQALTLPLLAPWPEGRYFMAGGLSRYILQEAAASALWIGGWALRLSYATSRCGYGLRGFYYNSTFSHVGDDAFAIDFSSYRRYVPYWNISGGTPVLSPADGIVRWSRGHIPSGGDWETNTVWIDHDDPATGTPRYLTKYLHLAGPGQVLVSTAMVAPTGRRLGLMNDTGISLIDHLHFSIHDRTLGPGDGPSVRPSPMNDQTLGDGDSGKCLRSTNRETIVPPSGCGAVLVEVLKRILGRR
ncbi:MAG TPA: peptidoglycan DD-metalloendopeptidase family protein [Gemmatimonadota bacterium]|nr:peptidoglycan DD-metalloendopeptidase family protein [Gemmatimonadota bacterium]